MTDPQFDPSLTNHAKDSPSPNSEPVAYFCPAGCGCAWRDNGDGSMSLLGANSKSCKTCERLPLDRLTPVYAAPPAPPALAEPVAYIDGAGYPHHHSDIQSVAEARLYGPRKPLYTHPPRAEPEPEPESDAEPVFLQPEPKLPDGITSITRHRIGG